MSDVSRQHWIACARAVLMLPGNTGLATQTTTSAGETAGTENTCAETSGWRWVWGWGICLLHEVKTTCANTCEHGYLPPDNSACPAALPPADWRTVSRGAAAFVYAQLPYAA